MDTKVIICLMTGFVAFVIEGVSGLLSLSYNHVSSFVLIYLPAGFGVEAHGVGVSSSGGGSV